MSDFEVIDTYRGLWKIEETFCVTKGVQKTSKLYSAEKIVECLNRISCSNKDENIYLFDYRSEVSDARGSSLEKVILGSLSNAVAQEANNCRVLIVK
jgi:hypothetical protein